MRRILLTLLIAAGLVAGYRAALSNHTTRLQTTRVYQTAVVAASYPAAVAADLYDAAQRHQLKLTRMATGKLHIVSWHDWTGPTIAARYSRLQATSGHMARVRQWTVYLLLIVALLVLWRLWRPLLRLSRHVAGGLRLSRSSGSAGWAGWYVWWRLYARRREVPFSIGRIGPFGIGPRLSIRERDQARNAILWGPPGYGKCLTADTLIDDPDTGARLTIEEAVRQKLPRVMSMSDTGCIEIAEITDWIDSGVQETYRVTTRLGRTVSVTGHHPFFTVDGWRPLHDLAVGSVIAVARRCLVEGHDESIHPDLARLLGYYIADGGLTHGSPAFTKMDPIIVQDFKDIIARHFPQCHITQRGITYYAVQPHWTRSTPNPVTQWLKAYGLWGKFSRDKRFPAQVWTWTNDLLAVFLSALISCDGSLLWRNGLAQVEFTVASEGLARDVQHALLRFGITARFRQQTDASWRVHFGQGQDVAIYQSRIGWIGEKATRWAAASRPFCERGYRVDGHVPAAVWGHIRTAVSRAGLTLSGLARLAGERGHDVHARRTITRERLAGYAHVLDDPALAKLAGDALYWDPIVSIEPLGRTQVYDLTVPHGSNFVAQDVFVHNTRLIVENVLRLSPRHKKRLPSLTFTDSKGSIYAQTAGWLSKLGYRVVRIDWLDPTSDGYNPLDPAHIQEPADAFAWAASLIENTGRNSDTPFWDDTTTLLLVATLFHLMEEHGTATLRAVQQFLAQPAATVKATLKRSNSPQAREAARGMLSFMEGNERLEGSVFSGPPLKFMALWDARIVETTRRNSVVWRDLADPTKPPVAVFVTLTPGYERMLRPFVGALFDQMNIELLREANNAGGTRKTLRRRVMNWWDEIGTIGKIADLPARLNTTREAGMGTVIGAQSTTQLDEIYTEAGRKIILQGCYAHLVLPGLRAEQAEAVAEELGQGTVAQRQGGATRDGGEILMKQGNMGLSEKGRPLLTADEVRQLWAPQLLAIVGNLRPVKLWWAGRWYWNVRLRRRGAITPPTSIPAKTALPSLPATGPTSELLIDWQVLDG